MHSLCHGDEAFAQETGSDYALYIRAFLVLGQGWPAVVRLELILVKLLIS